MNINRGDSVWKISVGTAATLIVTMLGTGMWLGSLQAKVSELENQQIQTQVVHAAMMVELKQANATLMEVKLSLIEERTQQRLLHKGQLPQ